MLERSLSEAFSPACSQGVPSCLAIGPWKGWSLPEAIAVAVSQVEVIRGSDVPSIPTGIVPENIAAVTGVADVELKTIAAVIEGELECGQRVLSRKVAGGPLEPAGSRPPMPQQQWFAVQQRLSVEVEVAQRLTSIRSLFGLTQGLLELFFQQVGLIFLGFNGLLKDGFLATVALLHRARGLFHIVERLGNGFRDVRNHGFCRDVNFQQRSAARTWHFKLALVLRHGGILPYGRLGKLDRRTYNTHDSS